MNNRLTKKPRRPSFAFWILLGGVIPGYIIYRYKMNKYQAYESALAKTLPPDPLHCDHPVVRARVYWQGAKIGQHLFLNQKAACVYKKEAESTGHRVVLEWID